ILARGSAAESDFVAFRHGSKGTLQVGTYQSVGARLLPRLLPKFAYEWPEVEVRLVEGLIDAQLLKMVETGDLDLTFTTFPTPPGPFQSLQLLKDPYVLTTPKDSPLPRSRSSVPLRGLDDHGLLGVATCRAEGRGRC